MMQRPSRPTGITILAILEILIGIVGLLEPCNNRAISDRFDTAQHRVVDRHDWAGHRRGLSVLQSCLARYRFRILAWKRVVLDSGNDLQYTLHTRSSRCVDDRFDNRWNRRYFLLEPTDILLDPDPCESVLWKRTTPGQPGIPGPVFAHAPVQPANSGNQYSELCSARARPYASGFHAAN